MRKVWIFLFVFALLSLVSEYVHADEILCPTGSAYHGADTTQCKDPVTVWLTTGVRSYHDDRQPGYNENNTGYGLEMRFDGEHAIYVGHYQNSLYRLTEYVGYAWQPINVKGVHIGFLNVIATGYTKTGRGTIIAPVPIASYDWERIGINAIIIPSVVTAIQLKVKLY